MRGAKPSTAPRPGNIITRITFCLLIKVLSRGRQLLFAVALTADEIVLHELAWAENRLRMYRHGFGGGGVSNLSNAVVNSDDLTTGGIQNNLRSNKSR
jgi:hypothetical protein